MSYQTQPVMGRDVQGEKPAQAMNGPTHPRKLMAGLSLGFLSLLAAWAGFLRYFGISTHWRPLVLPALLGLHLLLYVRRRWQMNRPGLGAPVYTSLGIGNGISLARGFLLALLSSFLFIPWPASPWNVLPGLLFTFIVLADFLDGLAARLEGHSSLLGEALDMHLDGLGVLIGSLILVRFGQMPWWFLLVGLARYLFLAGQRVLAWVGRSPRPLSFSPVRRALAGIMMGFIALALYPTFSPPATWIIGGALFVPFIVQFTRDFLAVAGYVDILTRVLSLTPVRWLINHRDIGLMGLRTFVGVLISAYLWQLHPVLLTQWGTVVVFVLAVVTLLFFLGILVRVDALALLVYLGVHLTHLPEQPIHFMLAVGAVLLLLEGVGKFTLCKVDDTLFLTRVGAQ